MHGVDLNNGDTERLLIVSSDKDFKQLHSFANVEQYDPIMKKAFLHVENPSRFLKEHVLRGDVDDGVPNVLSPDNCFVMNTRQKPLHQKKVDVWVDAWMCRSDPHDYDFIPEDIRNNLYRNIRLIDMQQVPFDVAERIELEYNSQAGKDRSKLFSYFVQNKLKNLMADLSEF